MKGRNVLCPQTSLFSRGQALNLFQEPDNFLQQGNKLNGVGGGGCLIKLAGKNIF